uniref:Uncharacterized protein n=1 Tax=Anopheles atroparvus TaxID=41427 RepID=A0A182JJI1_ANOAO
MLIAHWSFSFLFLFGYHHLRLSFTAQRTSSSSSSSSSIQTQKSHSKRHASQLMASSMMIEISKENAIQWDHPVVGAGGGPGGVIGAVGSSVAVAVAVGAAGVVGGDPDSAILLAGNGGPPGNHGPMAVPITASTAVASGTGGRQFLKGASVVTLKTAHGAGGGKISRKGGGFVKKKQKVLCDVGGSGSTGTGGVGVGGPGGGNGGKKIPEQLQVLRSTKEQTVPRKKIKVSPQTIVERSGLELCFKGGLGAGSLPNFLTAVPSALGELPLAGGGGGKKVSKSESKLLDVVVMNDMMQCDDSFDAAPCCSYSSASGAIVTTAPGAISKLISTYTQAENVVVPCSAGIGELPAVVMGGTGASIDAGGAGILECIAAASGSAGGSSSGDSSGGGGGVVKFGKASLKPKQKTKLAKSTKSSGVDASKKLLKKKRSLKTDTSLKRKKTRVKPALT